MAACFMDSLLNMKSDAITEQQLLRNVLAHFQGVRHREDTILGIGVPLSKFEPWIASIRDLALADDYEPLRNTSEHEHLLSVCLLGQTDEFTTALHSCRTRPLHPSPLQPAACIAARRKYIDILRLCLDEGARFDGHLNNAARLGARGNEEMLAFLLSRNWANMQNDPEKVLKHIKLYGEDSMEASWLREHAGKDLVVETIEGKTRTKIQSTHDKVDSIKGVNPKTRITPDQTNEWFKEINW